MPCFDDGDRRRAIRDIRRGGGHAERLSGGGDRRLCGPGENQVAGGLSHAATVGRRNGLRRPERAEIGACWKQLGSYTLILTRFRPRSQPCTFSTSLAHSNPVAILREHSVTRLVIGREATVAKKKAGKKRRKTTKPKKKARRKTGRKSRKGAATARTKKAAKRKTRPPTELPAHGADETAGVGRTGPDDRIFLLSDRSEVIGKISDLLRQAALAKHERDRKPRGEPSPNDSLWLRYDIGRLVQNYYHLRSPMGVFYGQRIMADLARSTGYEARSLYPHADYALLPEDRVREQVKAGLSWREAATQAKGGFIKWRDTLAVDELELQDAGEASTAPGAGQCR